MNFCILLRRCCFSFRTQHLVFNHQMHQSSKQQMFLRAKNALEKKSKSRALWHHRSIRSHSKNGFLTARKASPGGQVAGHCQRSKGQAIGRGGRRIARARGAAAWLILVDGHQFKTLQIIIGCSWLFSLGAWPLRFRKIFGDLIGAPYHAARPTLPPRQLALTTWSLARLEVRRCD